MNKNSNKFRAHCRHIAYKVREQIDAKIVLYSLSQDDALPLRVSTVNKKYQFINVTIGSLFYFSIRIDSWSSICIVPSTRLIREINMMNDTSIYQEDIRFKNFEEVIDFINRYI